MALNTSFISSDNIYVFPATKRGESYSQKARLLREESFTEDTKRLLDTDGFVVPDENGYPTTLCIKGYLIHLTLTSELLSILDSLEYVAVGLIKAGDYLELYGQDSNNKYEAVVFCDEQYSESNYKSDTGVSDLEFYKLRIWDKTLNKVPDSSLIKFNRKSVNIEYVDGGVF